MTTEILSVVDQKPLRVDADPSMVVVDLVNRDDSVSGGCYDRDLFLDLIRSELGVLIIDKADLPEVVPGKDGDLTIGGHEGYRREDSDVLPEWSARTESLRALALAEYLEAHPPVDEQQVEALEALLNETSDGRAQSAPNIARRLIATGKVTVQS